MASDKTIYGHINCPSCGTVGGVRITKDKNGEPFGFCEAKCEVQIRFGGKPYRVNEFKRNYPAIAAAMSAEAVTGTEKPAAPIAEKPAQPAQPAQAVHQAAEKAGFNLSGL